MRFFSNDARETNDELALDDRPERVQSDPVAVPNQRPPSPWSNTPAPAGDDIEDDDDDDRESSDDEARDAAAGPAAGTVTDDDTAGSQEPTAVFATPAREDGRWGAADRDADDSAVTSPDTPYAGGSATADPQVSWVEDEDRTDRGGPADEVDVPLDDEAVPGDASGDTEAAPANAEKIDARDDSESDDDEEEDDDDAVEAVAAEHRDDASAESDADADPDAGLDDAVAAAPVAATPVAATPVADAPIAADDTPATGEPATGSAEPALVPVPVGAAATAPAAGTETIFGADDAKSFQERWREVQLRFVDSPKDAAAEATTLIDEAVEKLTAGLKAQRDGLTDDTEDTERLRLQLRGYRDILNRILSL